MCCPFLQPSSYETGRVPYQSPFTAFCKGAWAAPLILQCGSQKGVDLYNVHQCKYHLVRHTMDKFLIAVSNLGDYGPAGVLYVKTAECSDESMCLTIVGMPRRVGLAVGNR